MPVILKIVALASLVVLASSQEPHYGNGNCIYENVTVGCYKYATVKGSQMAYLDTGHDVCGLKTVVFLHGNPTSSFLWRNVIPRVNDIARCIAPDLIGMGKSDKVPGLMYTFKDHEEYLAELFEKIDLPPKAEYQRKRLMHHGTITLVVHDWGSGHGFHWANQNRHRIESLVFMESVTGPPQADLYDEESLGFFKLLRSPQGEDFILKQNMFVEQLLQTGIMRNLTEKEMAAYREPFLEEGESRRPMLTFPRDVYIQGLENKGNEYVGDNILSYSKWLSEVSWIPKLFIDAQPGLLQNFIKVNPRTWPNVKVVEVKGLHFVQEDSPHEIGDAIHDFLVNTVR